MTFTSLAHRARPVPGLTAAISDEGAATVIALRGEADPATLAVLIDTLVIVIADHDGAVVVDLAGTEFIDTAAVRAIGQAAQFLGDHGRQLSLRSPSRLAARMLAVFGLSHLVDSAGQ